MLGGRRRIAIFLGNSIFGDDSIALAVAERLSLRLQSAGYEVATAERTGFVLLDYLEGYDSATIVDSARADESMPGTVREYTPRDFRAVKPTSPHYAGIPEALELMETFQIGVPRVRIIGIAIRDPYILSTSLSEELQVRLTSIAEQVYDRIVADAHEESGADPYAVS